MNAAKRMATIISIYLCSSACSTDNPISLEWSPTSVKFDRFEVMYLSVQEIELLGKSNTVKAYYYSNIGEDEMAINSYDENCREDVHFSLSGIDLEEYEFRPALQYIYSRVDSFQIMAINETHHEPRHRRFTTSMLQVLYDKGFRHFGVEAIDKSFYEYFPSSTENYPIYNTGSLVREPSMARMIRKAIQIGFTIFPYEYTGSGREREIGQANNVASYIDQPNFSGKVLIHCGYDHAVEGTLEGPWEYSMIERLKAKLGVEVLTINQTVFRQRGRPDCEEPLYKTFNLDEPSVFVPTENPSNFKPYTKKWMDIYVFHPRDGFAPKDAIYKKVNFENLGTGILNIYSDSSNIKSTVPERVIQVQDSIQNIWFYGKGEYTLLHNTSTGEQYLSSVYIE